MKSPYTEKVVLRRVAGQREVYVIHRLVNLPCLPPEAFPNPTSANGVAVGERILPETVDRLVGVARKRAAELDGIAGKALPTDTVPLVVEILAPR